MEQGKILENTKKFVENFFKNEFSGHDYFHTMRVYKMATRIAEAEGADIFVAKMATLLHDVDDDKLPRSGDNAINFLKSQNLSSEMIDKIMYIIENQSFRNSIGQNTRLQTLEAMVVQDADRLDGIGAIGISRVFAYGGNKNRQIHNPGRKAMEYQSKEYYHENDSTSINHFYEKLLKLKDMMNTETAKEIAEHRHKFMEDFLEEFFAEWDGEK